MSGERSALDEALRWLRRGASPIPVPYRSKAPAIAGWQALRLDKAGVVDAFITTPTNIGVLWGEPSRGLVDVDLDAPLAPDFGREL